MNAGNEREALGFAPSFDPGAGRRARRGGLQRRDRRAGRDAGAAARSSRVQPRRGRRRRVGLDVGRVSIHRLNNLEYDNTMRDLLGVDGMAQKTFQPDEQGEFDNDADAFTMNDARYEQYFNSADTIGEAVFADTAATGLRQTYVYGLVTPACTPSATDTACSSKIISAFAQKAWRRPLTTTEVTGLVKLATDAITLGETADDSIKQVVKTLLASPQFLYRIEFDPNPTSLDGARARSRTSSRRACRTSAGARCPTRRCSTSRRRGRSPTDAILTAQIDRMLADPKGANFTNSFAGQWLGARDMQAHQVEPTAFPTFDEPLRAAFVQEELMYFNEFLTGPLPMTQFFTTPDELREHAPREALRLPGRGRDGGLPEGHERLPEPRRLHGPRQLPDVHVVLVPHGARRCAASGCSSTCSARRSRRRPPSVPKLDADGAADGPDRAAGGRPRAPHDAPHGRGRAPACHAIARSDRPRPRELRRHRRLPHEVLGDERDDHRRVGHAADGRDLLVAQPARGDPLDGHARSSS